MSGMNQVLGNARPVSWTYVVYSLSQIYTCSFFSILFSICLTFSELALEYQDKVDMVPAFQEFLIFRTEFLKLGTMDILDCIILCHGGLSCALFSSVPGVFPLDDSSTLPVPKS